MRNRWFTYSFLAVMVIALVALAVLQYQWLGSVSNAERQRLEESIAASAENFISDLNENFAKVRATFRVQVTNAEEPFDELAKGLLKSEALWGAENHQKELVEAVYLIRMIDSKPKVFSINNEKTQLDLAEPNTKLARWLKLNEKEFTNESTNVSLSTLPNFGAPSFMQIPVQVLEFLNLNRQDGVENLEVQLSINQLDDFVLIEFNDNYIKDILIPKIASRYLGESYQEQYDLAIVKPKSADSVYFRVNNIPENPEFVIDLDRINFTSLIMFDDRFPSESMGQMGDSLEVSYYSLHSESRTTSKTQERRFSHIKTRINDLETLEVNDDLNTEATMKVTEVDTSIRAAFIGNMSAFNWQLWLSFRAGSLDEFVSKTRNRNLSISFGILLVLGIGGVLIVIVAQRSRDLAEQQMLFVAGVSHELRTPLAVIRSAAENLTEGVVQNEVRKKEYAQLMLDESKRLSDMVDQIMEFSGIQSGRRIYNYSEVALDALLQAVLSEIKPIADQEKMSIEYVNISKVSVLRADKDALFLAITNLIRNAIKFSDEQKNIVLRVDEVTFRSDLALRIQVQDFGVGIPEEEQKKIFQPFYRAEYAVAEQIKGNGIGLSLVERVAKEHNGEISVKSTPGVGSTFSLLIPIQR